MPWQINKKTGERKWVGGEEQPTGEGGATSVELGGEKPTKRTGSRYDPETARSGPDPMAGFEETTIDVPDVRVNLPDTPPGSETDTSAIDALLGYVAAGPDPESEKPEGGPTTGIDTVTGEEEPWVPEGGGVPTDQATGTTETPEVPTGPDTWDQGQIAQGMGNLTTMWKSWTAGKLSAEDTMKMGKLLTDVQRALLNMYGQGAVDNFNKVINKLGKPGGAGPTEPPPPDTTVEPGDVTTGERETQTQPVDETTTETPPGETLASGATTEEPGNILDQILDEAGPGEEAPEATPTPETAGPSGEDLLAMITEGVEPSDEQVEAGEKSEERMRTVDEIIADLGKAEPETELEKGQHEVIKAMLEGASPEERKAFQMRLDKQMKGIRSAGAYAGIAQGSKVFGKQAEAAATGEAQFAAASAARKERGVQAAANLQGALDKRQQVKANMIMAQENLMRQRDEMNLDENYRNTVFELQKADTMHTWGLQDTQIAMAKQMQSFNISMRQAEFTEQQRQDMIQAGFTGKQIELMEDELKLNTVIAEKNWGFTDRQVDLQEKQFGANQTQQLIDNGFSQDKIDLLETELYNNIDMGKKKFDADQIQRMKDNGFTDQQIAQAQQQLDQSYELSTRELDLNEMKNAHDMGLADRMFEFKEQMDLREADFQDEKFWFAKEQMEKEFNLKLSAQKFAEFIQTGRLELDIIDTKWQQDFADRKLAQDYMLTKAGLDLQRDLGMTQIEVNAAIAGEWMDIAREERIWKNYFDQQGLNFDWAQLNAGIKAQREAGEGNMLGMLIQVAATAAGTIFGGPAGGAAAAAATSNIPD